MNKDVFELRDNIIWLHNELRKQVNDNLKREIENQLNKIIKL